VFLLFDDLMPPWKKYYINIGGTVFQLDDLGTLCGLMPDVTPSETELQTVCMLLSGIGKTQGKGKKNWLLSYV